MSADQDRLNLAASAYLDAVRAFLEAAYGEDWKTVPEQVQLAAVVSSGTQTLLLPAAHSGIQVDMELAFTNIGVALGGHIGSVPDETFTHLMGMLAQGAGHGRAHRVAQIINWPTVGNA